MLLARYKRKLFLYRIVTGDERFIHFQNLKRKRAWVTPSKSATSTVWLNRYGLKMDSAFGEIRRMLSTMSYFSG